MIENVNRKRRLKAINSIHPSLKLEVGTRRAMFSGNTACHLRKSILCAMFSRIQVCHVHKSSNLSIKVPCFFGFRSVTCTYLEVFCKITRFCPVLQREWRNSICLFCPNMAETPSKSASLARHLGIQNPNMAS